MAYAEFGAFRPSESAFVNPGEYEKTQRAIALEKANYLSSMDQFYKDLEEKGREFDLTLGLERSRLKLEEKQYGLQERMFAERQKEFELQFGLQQNVFEERQREFEAQLGLEEEKLAMEESQFATNVQLQNIAMSIEEYAAKLKQEEMTTAQANWLAEFEESKHQFEEQVRLKEEEISLASHTQSSQEGFDWLTGGLDLIGGIGSLFG